MADLAPDPVLRCSARAGAGAPVEPSRSARRATSAARRGHVGHASQPACRRRGQQTGRQLGAGHRAGRGPAGRDRRPAHHGQRIAQRVRVGRSSRDPSAGPLSECARHDRVGRSAAGLDGHGDRHDRDLRIAGTHRRRQPRAARARHLGGALQHRVRAHDRNPFPDVLPLLPRPRRRCAAHAGAIGRAAADAPHAAVGAAATGHAARRQHA